MKRKLLILLCLLWGISGCASVKPSRETNHKNTTEENILQLQETIAQKDIEIKKLNDLIKEKDTQIKELKERLSTFGVFE